MKDGGGPRSRSKTRPRPPLRPFSDAARARFAAREFAAAQIPTFRRKYSPALFGRVGVCRNADARRNVSGTPPDGLRATLGVRDVPLARRGGEHAVSPWCKWAMKVPISTVRNSSLLSACQLVVHEGITVCASGGPSRSSSETSRAVRSIHVTSGESGQASLASPTTLCLLLNASAILTNEQGDYLSCCPARAQRLHLGER